MRTGAEGAMIQRFYEKIRTFFPELFWYKIPDFPGGPLRPFDVFAVISGHTFCIEFKIDDALKPHQIFFLELARKNGAISFSVYPETFDSGIERIQKCVRRKK